MRSRIHGLILVCGVLSGCVPSELPVTIQLGPIPDPIYSSDRDVPIRPVALDRVGVVPHSSVQLSVTPPGIATLDSDDVLHCERTGDAVLSAAIGTLSRSIAVKCRLAQIIKAPRAVRLRVGQELPLSVSVLDETGRTLADVPIEISLSNTAIAATNPNGLIKGRAVGTTVAIVRAGDLTAVTNVEVVRMVDRARLALDPGSTLRVLEEPGKYELAVTVQRGAAVAVSWEGAESCPSPAAADGVTTTCQLDITGAAVIQNPAPPGVRGHGVQGGRAEGIFEILELP
jgi:hypothetical protein